MGGASAVSAFYASSVPERIVEKKARFRPVSGPGPSFAANSIGRARRQARQKIWHSGGDSGTCRWRRERKACVPARRRISGRARLASAVLYLPQFLHGFQWIFALPAPGQLRRPALSGHEKRRPFGRLSVSGNVGWNEPAGLRPAWRSVRCWTPRVRSGCRGRSGGSFRVPQR